MVKQLFTSKNLTQAHVLAVLGDAVTAVVTFVPAWAPEKQVIIAALGGVVSNIYPLVTAVHKAVDVIESLVSAHKVTLASIEANAADVVKSEVGKIDFNKIVSDIEGAHGLTASGVEALVEAKLKSLLGGLASAAPVPPAPVQSPPVGGTIAQVAQGVVGGPQA